MTSLERVFENLIRDDNTGIIDEVLSWDAEQQYLFNDRAAGLEYGCGMPRRDAEKLAFDEMKSVSPLKLCRQISGTAVSEVKCR